MVLINADLNSITIFYSTCEMIILFPASQQFTLRAVE